MTIFKKSLITLGLAAFGFTAAFIISIMVFMDSLYHEVNIAGLGNTARTLVKIIGEDRIAQFFLNETDEQNIENIFPPDAYDTYRLTLIAPSGYVLWDSHVTERLVNHMDRKEVIEALEGREGSSKRESVSTGMERIYYALPVFDGNNNTVGAFRLSFIIPEFSARISPVIIPFIVFLAVIIIAAFWAIYMYSRSLSSSLGRLVSIAQTSAPLLSGSEFETHIAPEFLSLERAMRAMSDELNARFLQAKSESSRFEAILNGMAEAVFAMNSSLKLHLVNPKARELFKLGDSDINVMTLLEATHSTELVETVKKAISSGSPIETELTFHGAAEQQLLVHASPLDSNYKDLGAANAANAQGAVLVLQEITQLVKLEKIRKDFVANVSHELRTPIQLVKGFSETLSDAISSPDKNSKKEMLHFLEIISKNAVIMENLTNDLLTLSSLENNSINRETETVNIASIINEAVSSVEPQAKKKQIDINIKCSEDLNAQLHGSLIIQALINLIDNAVKYSSSKSKVWINAYLFSGEESDQENDTLIFEVRDKGMGISSEHLERIFERFYRVDRGRSREEGGTGLGLSIVRHIALLHKGNAEAESHAGEGSVFRIKIPFLNH